LLYLARKKSYLFTALLHFVKNEAGQAELVSPKHGKSFGTASLIYLLFILSTNPVSSLAGRAPLIFQQEPDSSRMKTR
jgi:hypothetical protein